MLGHLGDYNAIAKQSFTGIYHDDLLTQLFNQASKLSKALPQVLSHIFNS